MTPVVSRLPLRDDQMSWERFEAFSRALIETLPDVDRVEPYGGRGSPQHGIDFIAHLKSGATHAYQCKQVASFSRSETKNAITAATFPAPKKTLLLSIQASSGVRDEIHATTDWECWDVEDISNAVRQLAPDAARELIRIHFGSAWVEPFLGILAYSAFVPWQEYFWLLLRNDGLLRHVWPLVGRNDVLSTLDEFVCDPESLIAVLPGRGGIGKSRVLLEFAKRFTDSRPDGVMRFVGDDVTIDAASLTELPLECVIVLDDAHRRPTEASRLVDLAKRGKGKVKVVFATRPYGVDSLLALLAERSLPLERRRMLATLGDLGHDDVLSLARGVLGLEYERHAEHLVAVCRDSPLVTVIGGRLLATKQLPPELLASDTDFYHEALVRFRDAMLGSLGDRIDPEHAKSLLRLLAAVAPVDSADPQFLDAASAFLDVPRDEVVRAVDELEHAGVLRRRRNRVRITPDVLADYLLEESCLTRTGSPTGHAIRVYEAFPGVESGLATPLLRNLAELDWRVTKTTGSATKLLKEIWEHVTAKFRASSRLMREVILHRLEDVAHLQPAPVLEIIEIDLREPPGVPDEFSLPRHGSYPFAVPGLLQRVGYHLSHLPHCCAILWELGRDEPRPPSADLPAPLKVIARFAEYAPGIPFLFPATVLEFVERQIAAESDVVRIDMLLSIVEPLLARVLRLDKWERDRILLSGAPLQMCEGLQPIRDRALSVFAACARNDNAAVAVRGIERLARILDPLYAPPYVTISVEDHVRWHPEQRRVLALLNDIARNNTNSVIRARIVQAARDRVFLCTQTELLPAAQDLLDAIPQDLQIDLLRVLIEHDWENPREARLPMPVSGHLRSAHQLVPEVAARLLAEHSRPADLANRLNDAIRMLDQAGVHPDSAAEFLLWLMKHSSMVAAGLADYALNAHTAPLASWFALFLMEAARIDATKGINLAMAAVENGSAALCYGVARAFEISDHHALSAGSALIERLFCHSAEDVRVAAVRAVRKLAATDPSEARRLVLKVNIARSQSVAHALFSLFNHPEAISVAVFSDEDIRALIANLDGVNLDDYDVAAFLVEASKRVPGTLLAVLLDRIRNRADAEPPPMPHLSFNPSLIGFQSALERPVFLRLVRDEMLGAQGIQRWWLIQLFHAIALGFDSGVQDAILEWVDSGEESKLLAALALLERDSPSFIWTHRDFVSHCLRQAHATSSDCYDEVCSLFARVALDGMRSSGFGRPPPKDIAVRDEASKIASTMSAGSPERRFYEKLSRVADHRAQRSVEEDEEILDRE